MVQESSHSKTDAQTYQATYTYLPKLICCLPTCLPACLPYLTIYLTYHRKLTDNDPLVAPRSQVRGPSPRPQPYRTRRLP